MIYVNKEYFERLLEEEEQCTDLSYLLKGMEFFDSDEDVYYEDFDLNLYEATREKFTGRYLPKVFLLCLEFYPQLHSKSNELKEKLLKEFENIFEALHDMHAYYIDGNSNVEIKKDCSYEIDINGISSFVRNNHLDYLLENYAEWYKLKISFENIYVESFYAAVFVKNYHSLLVNILYNFFPVINCLSTEELDNISANLINDAWRVYCLITLLDPDELNDSHVLFNLEDYEYESLINYRGPEIIRNEKGKIMSIKIPRNGPNPAKVPVCCLQCKSFNNNAAFFLCTANRFNHQNAESFSCRAYEKIDET